MYQIIIGGSVKTEFDSKEKAEGFVQGWEAARRCDITPRLNPASIVEVDNTKETIQCTNLS